MNAQAVPEDSDTPSVLLRLVDKALSIQAPVVQAHISRVRRNRPSASPADVVKRLNGQLRASTITSGAAVGASAAAPGVGTAVAATLSAAETAGFLEAAALYVLAVSEIHGIGVTDLERRRALFLAIMLGDLGASSVGKVAGRTGPHWARAILRGIPQSKISGINKVLGRYFVTKYGTKQGIVVLGRVVPFGIGMVIGGTANAAMTQGVIKATKSAFGPPPTEWPDIAEVSLPAPTPT